MSVAFVGIVGSREFPNSLVVSEFVKSLPDNAIVVSGGQPRGVDGFAKAAALRKGLHYIEFGPAHFFGIPYQAEFFFSRNSQIVAHSDILHAFMHRESGGTMHTVRKAVRRGIPVVITDRFGKEVPLCRESHYGCTVHEPYISISGFAPKFICPKCGLSMFQESPDKVMFCPFCNNAFPPEGTTRIDPDGTFTDRKRTL